MADAKPAINFRDHGTVLETKNKTDRVKCNYCSKVVSGFSRLKCHLGGVRGDVTPCEQVPSSVKELLRSEVLEKKEKMTREVEEKLISITPLKRNKSTDLINFNHNKNRQGQNLSLASRTTEEAEASSENGRDECSPFLGRRISPQITNSRETENSSRTTKKLIGRFFYETNTDLSAVSCLSFRRLMSRTADNHCHLANEIPSCQELKGWILQEEVAEIKTSINCIKSSWEQRGCSILLDAWVNDRGQSLVNFLVDCPPQAMYLRSSDISAIVDNVEALQSLLDEIIEQVGSKNVVQVVASSTDGWMGAVSKKFVETHPYIFWTFSASYCIGLILEQIGMLDSTKNLLNKAKSITRLIYGHGVSNLLRDHGHYLELFQPFKVKSAMPFIALENIVSEKNKIREIFSSSEWKSSIWASKEEGTNVMELVEDLSFWNEAERVLKAAIPLVNVLHWIDESDIPHAGLIYETMDQAKETIKEEFRNVEPYYMPIWELIDEIWNNILYSHLHGTGYYLNPNLRYSDDFSLDDEVAFGMLNTIVRLVEDKATQTSVTLQLYKYSQNTGTFEAGKKASQQNKMYPVLLWSKYGNDCPELQSFAIRVLSQTCDGASRYGLKRTMAEKLLSKKRYLTEQRQLADLTFVHYNLQLLQYKAGAKCDVVMDEVDHMNDWIAESPESGSNSSDPTRMVYGRSGHFGLQVKEEPVEGDSS